MTCSKLCFLNSVPSGWLWQLAVGFSLDSMKSQINPNPNKPIDNMSESIADFENMMSLDQPIKSAAPCRWERKQQACLADRFIPNRAGMERTLSQCAYYDDLARDGSDESSDSWELSKVLSNSSDNSCDSAQSRVLSFKNKAPAPKDGYQSSLKVLYTQQAGKKCEVAKPTRHIPSAPVRILDAPDMMDDYCE